MGYAEISVNSAIARRQTFSYAIPPGLDVKIGQAVLVPFGSKTLQGIVFELTEIPAVSQTRDIAGIIDLRPVLTPAQVSLAGWISDYYLSPLFEAAALMLPPGFERKVIIFLSPSPESAAFDTSSLTPEQKQAFDLISSQNKINLKEIEKKLGKKKASAAVSALIKYWAITRTYELQKERVKPKIVLRLVRRATPEVIRSEAEHIRKRSPKKAALLDFIAGHGEVDWTEARRETGCAKSAAEALAGGLFEFRETEVRRMPLSDRETAEFAPPVLTSAQRSVLGPIKSALVSNKPNVFLLHGVTASGKTEIYLQALAEAVRLGKRGIVLVPEIALTPQTIERFSSRFPGRVAVLHSRLSLGEQFDEWQRIRDGECDVVIGPRSALFAPQPDLGLIVIDEEHEWTYKQDDSPRYHARTVAVEYAGLTGATVVLGSATPDVETYYHAEKGAYTLLELPERVAPAPGAAPPPVAVVDLREELKQGNRSLFSRPLEQALAGALERGEQAILFINRRGAATFVQCRKCGLVFRCKRCDVALTHHPDEGSLVCHQCNYHMPVPGACPRCGSGRIKFLGLGTQATVEETALAFRGARIMRWDSDAVKGKDSHQEILSRFRAHEADILVGTQMVARGLDLPQVTVVGVIKADTGLNLPDFRAGERTFQLLSQVAGRAGRGMPDAKVIIQTFSPQHYAIQAAASHDYRKFYEQEIKFRRALRYPPFVRLARLVYAAAGEDRCRFECDRMKSVLLNEIESKGLSGFDVTGPAPAFVKRRRGKYRWQLTVRGNALSEFLAGFSFPAGWTIDIDAVGLD